MVGWSQVCSRTGVLYTSAMRLYLKPEPIRVTELEGQPSAFRWMGHTYRIDTVEDVREPRLDWWSPLGEQHRVYYLVVTTQGMIAEIYEDRVSGEWRLARVFD